MSALSEYLMGLNTSDSQWGLWVNPENPTEEFRIGQYCFENGGLDDDWVCVGSLDRLSFGFQSESEAFEDCFKISPIFEGTPFEEMDEDEVYDLYCQEELPSDLQAQVDEYIEDWQSQAAEWEADYFVDQTLPEILESAKACA